MSFDKIEIKRHYDDEPKRGKIPEWVAYIFIVIGIIIATVIICMDKIIMTAVYLLVITISYKIGMKKIMREMKKCCSIKNPAKCSLRTCPHFNKS